MAPRSLSFLLAAASSIHRNRAHGCFARFVRDENGFVLVFFAIALPALIGLVGLAIDGVRLMTLDTQMASIADAGALAAANELDRSKDALARARAAAGALNNRATNADSFGAATHLSFRFAARLSDLQRSRSFTLDDDSGTEAAYVEVTTSPATLATSFLQLIGAKEVPLRRRAIAESQYYACDVTPAVLCHADPDTFVSRARPGQQFLLRMDGNINTGSLALLDRSDEINTRQALRNLADNAPRFCYSADTRLRTNIAPTEFEEAINVRFDRYVGRTGPIAADLAVFPPAPSVVQGRHLNTCASPPQGGDINPPYRLPRDSAYQGLRLNGFWNQGVGDWKIAPAIGGTGLPVTSALNEYIAWNHDNKAPDVQDRLRSASTRYELYLAEMGLTLRTETNPVDTRSYQASAATMPTGGPNNGPFRFVKESPVPICYAGNRPAVEARRRILYLTVADCGTFRETATASTLSRRVAKFFLTEPAELGAILAEFVNLIEPQRDDGKLRHVVQLVDAE